MSTSPHDAPLLRHDTPAVAPSGVSMPRERRVVVWLAVLTVLVFGVVCTVLGIGVTRAVNPCRSGCTPTAGRRLAEVLLLVGPGLTALTAAALSLRAMRQPHHPRPWLAAVLGCLAAIMTVFLGSLLVNGV